MRVPAVAKRPPTETLAERLWRQVQRGDGCWPFIGARSNKGYGYFKHDGVARFAHRVAYADANGPIPDGIDVLHRCDNPPCCRPDHLFLGTQADNVADMISKGRDRKAVGSRTGNARLTEAKVVDIRRRHRKRVVTAQMLADEHGVSVEAVEKVLQRQTWRHVP